MKRITACASASAGSAALTALVKLFWSARSAALLTTAIERRFACSSERFLLIEADAERGRSNCCFLGLVLVVTLLDEICRMKMMVASSSSTMVVSVTK